MTHARLLPLVLLLAGCPDNGPKKLILLHTTDEHSHLIGFGPEVDDYPAPTTAGTGTIKGGIGRRAKVLADERARAKAMGASTLTLSAGDNSMGTLAQAGFTTGAPDFVAMWQLGYDASCLGNHEFDFGPAALAQALTVGKTGGGLMKVLSSNIHFSDTDPGDDSLAALYDAAGTDESKLVHKSWVLTTENGLKVGLVGIMGVDASKKATVKPPVRFSAASDDEAVDVVLPKIYADVQPVVDDLRKNKKVDLVIAMSHTGVNTLDLPASEDYKICQNVAGIDVILSGHTHVEAKAFSVENLTSKKKCHIQSAGKFGEAVGRMALTVESGTVKLDEAGSTLVPVDDKVVSDPAFNVNIDNAIKSVEGPKLMSGKSFTEETLGRILGMTIADTEKVGDLYFYPIGKTDFTVLGKADQKETPLMDMIADATLAAAEKYGGPTHVAVVGQGVLRADLEKSKSGDVSLGDVFRILPLGISTKNGSIGYPICRAMLLAVEMKAAFEVAAGYAYTSPDAGDFYLVGGGIKIEYDTSRPAIDGARLRAQPADFRNGRITKMFLATDHSKPDVFDRQIFDVNGGGWINGVTFTDPFMVAANLYVVQFAYVAGVEPKNTMGMAVKPEDVIMNRGDGSEIKDWEALSEYLRAQPEMKVPARYMDPAPKRMICSGPICKP